jgi:hypothetical protein
VAHTCNPSYSGGRDQEDCSLKTALARRSRAPRVTVSQKKSITNKRAGEVAQGVGPEFKPRNCKKKKKKKMGGGG